MIRLKMRFLRTGVNLRSLLILTLLSLMFTLYLKLYYYKDEPTNKMRKTLRIREFCGETNETSESLPDDLDRWGLTPPSARKNSAHIVIVARKSHNKKEIRDVLETLKLRYKYFSSETHFRELKNAKGKKHFVIMFENIDDYFKLKVESKKILDDYCVKNRVGIIGLAWPGETRDVSPEQKLLFSVSRLPANVDTVHVHNESIIRLLKPNLKLSNWVESAGFNWFSGSLDVLLAMDESAVVLHEPVHINGIPKIIISRQSVHLWMYKMLLMDSLHYLTNSKISFPLTRHIQIDIDDIFVGSARLTKEDVVALMQSQNNLANLIPSFRYNLGYSGSYFMKGTSQENEGDQMLLDFKDKFNWFPHMWHHIQPHKFHNVTDLVSRMQKNYNFAMEKGLPINGGYSVAPHHSGVYPVHEQLYTAWKQVWGINATSTEEYPSLYPARKRRGFVYRNISVLPRQTCGLFTKNLYYDEYPGGSEKMEHSISGGEIFETILTNPISIFMTHMPNYCCDRLAPYLFESLLSFVTCFTNLKVTALDPLEVSQKYFKLFPEERKPVWTDPCKDHRHLEIYSPNKSCSQLPDFLIVGPQKTGSTALYSFLKLHPNIVSNNPSLQTFEELQFYSNDKNYLSGLDWYKEYFPVTNSSIVMFEKSATYFDGENVPHRAHKLLPTGKIVILLLPPEDRAYSWYHHMRAHDQPTSLNYSFDQVVRASSTSPKDLLALKSRCLEPGKYALHINKWLTYYRPKQIYIMDGVQLKQDPVTAINNLQKFLEVPFVDFKSKLMFDKRKGFFCPIVNGRKKCLGKGKGRQYPPLEEDTRNFLLDYFDQYNTKLLDLLTQHGFPVPSWLLSEEE